MTGSAEVDNLPGAATKSPWLHWAALGAVCALVIGVYAWSAYSGIYELWGAKPANSYYNLLVHGLREGHLNVQGEAPRQLALLADPYDPSLNRPYLWPEDHSVQDMSYYQGKLYLYFGITPALVLFGPYAVLTGHYLLHREAAIIFCAIGFLANAALLWSAWSRYYKQVGFGIVLAGTLALGLATGVPVILQRCDVHEVAISCGYALSMASLVALWQALHGARRQTLWLAAASLLYGLAIGSRPSLLFGAVILVVPVVQARLAHGRWWIPALAAATPIIFVGLGLMLYNTLRFGNPLEFGWRYQLCGDRQDIGQHFSLRYVWFNFRTYLLQAAPWREPVSLMNNLASLPRPAGHLGAEHAFGIVTSTPFALLALAAPLAWRGILDQTCSGLRWFLVTVALLLAGTAVTLGAYYYACARFELEFLPELTLLAVLGTMELERTLTGRGIWLKTAQLAAALLLAYSLAANLLISLERGVGARVEAGSTFLLRGRADQAMVQFQRALAIRTTDASARFGLGNALFAKGQVEEAIAQFRSALEGEPDYAEAHNNLGIALARQGRWDEAIVEYRAAMKSQPAIAETHNSLAYALLQEGRTAEAINHYEDALRLKPGDATAHNNLGMALSWGGQLDASALHFQRALELRPDQKEAADNLARVAWVLATSPEASVRDGAKALRFAQFGNRYVEKDPIVLRSLAAAEAEAGRFTEAIAAAREGLRLATVQSNSALAADLQADLDLYRLGSPVREPVPGTQPAALR